MTRQEALNILGVDDTAGPAELESAFRRLKALHELSLDSPPGGPDLLKIQAAYELLRRYPGPFPNESQERRLAADRARLVWLGAALFAGGAAVVLYAVLFG